MTLSWSQIDYNSGSRGYLDEIEVNNAKKKGVTNAFVGMIQEDYEGTLDIDKIKEKYDKGSNGRMPIYGSAENRKKVIRLYRELVVLQCKYQNLKEEYTRKYSLLDDFKNFLSKIKIFKENIEYTNTIKQLEDVGTRINLKEKELSDTINTVFYEPLHANLNEQVEQFSFVAYY